MRKLILIPAIALTAGLLLSATAHAQPPRPKGPAGPGGGFRPGLPAAPRVVNPGPVVGVGIGIRPSPRLGIGISIGSPIVAPPLFPPSRPPVVIVDPICEHYRVIFRDCSHDPWQVYRVYESHRAAHYVADQLRDMGYQARVLHD